MPATAQLTVVLATDRRETLRPVIAALRRQTICDRIELVIAMLEDERSLTDWPGLEAFAGYVVVQPGKPSTLSQSRGAGVRASTAPVVVIGETHAFPHADWAEKLLQAKAAGWSAVVPGIRNANPEGAISWANLLIDYGRWLDILPAGPVDSCPPYNTAFDRTFALRLAELDDHAFSPGGNLRGLLPDARHAIYLEPEAKIDHVNVSRGRFWLSQRFFAARAHAAVRSRAWSWRRRFVYAIGAPLIPAVVLARLSRPVRAALRARQLPLLTLPALVAGAAAGALGELTAFVAGAGTAGERVADGYELHKISYTRMRA